MKLRANLLLAAALTALRAAVVEAADCAEGSANCVKCAVAEATRGKIQVTDITSNGAHDTDAPDLGYCSAATGASDGKFKECCLECAVGYGVTPKSDSSRDGALCVQCTTTSKCAKCVGTNAAGAGKEKCTACPAGFKLVGGTGGDKDKCLTCDADQGYSWVSASATTNECKKTSSASGDPHVTNIRGEAFDVLREGTMEVVVLPRGASPGSPIHHLTVQAKIARASKKLCEATFIERVSVFGSWLGGGSELTIDAGTVHDMTPLRLKLGSANEWTDWEKVHLVLNSENPQIPKTTITSSRDEGKHPTIRVAFDIGDQDISLLVSLFQHKHFSFLNLNVDGLESYEAEVGGILGLDSHSLAATPDVECEHKFSRMHNGEGVEMMASTMIASLAASG